MKKIISFILAVCILLLTSSCNNTTIHNQSNSIPYQTNSIEISDDNEISEQEKTDYYVLNTRTKKIHLPSCYYAKKIAEKNYATTDDLQSALDEGYSKCQKCHPK